DELPGAGDAVGEVLVLAQAVAVEPFVEAERREDAAAVGHVAANEGADLADADGRGVVGDEPRALDAATRPERVHQEDAAKEVREAAAAANGRHLDKTLRTGDRRIGLEQRDDTREIVGREDDVVV